MICKDCKYSQMISEKYCKCDAPLPGWVFQRLSELFNMDSDENTPILKAFLDRKCDSFDLKLD